LHPDLIYFIEQIKKKGLHFRLYTNAQNITEELCVVMQGMDLSPVSVTIYSSCDSIHDSITQVPGSLQKTIRGIKLFNRYNVPVQVSVPVTRFNVEGFRELYDFCCTELNIKAFGPNPFISYTINHKRSNANILPTPEDIKKFADTYYSLAIERGFNIIPNKFEFNWKDYHLYQGMDLTIQYDGTIVGGAILSDIILGNIATDSLSDIWDNSPLLERWRHCTLEETDRCASCPFLELCMPNIGDNWVANQDLLQLDEHWCESNKQYYTRLFDLSEGGKYLIEVNGRPGFVFSPNETEVNEDGKFAQAFFSEKIAKLKYEMSDEECNELRNKQILVKLN
jgi:radical SAM protein with 4Fe4S-binding SPASM domain